MKFLLRWSQPSKGKSFSSTGLEFLEVIFNFLVIFFISFVHTLEMRSGKLKMKALLDQLVRLSK